MEKDRILAMGCLLVFSAVLAPLGISNAAIDKFEPYVFTRVLYDSNIFRVSGDQEAIALLGDDNKDDTIGHLGAGFQSDLKLSRQHLLLDGELDRAIYDTYDELDHTRVKGNATWAWQVGNLWSGNLGAGYGRSLSSFNEQLVPTKDMRTEKTGFLNGGYQIHPDWRLRAGVSIRDVSFQDRKRLDRKANGGHLDVMYSNTVNSHVGVSVAYTDNDLQNTLDIAEFSVSNDYTETAISGFFYWEGSAKSALEARLGYTEQSYDDFDDRDYNGTTGRLTYHWRVTGKTKMDIDVWRETSTLSDEITSYVLAKGVSIKPVWLATSLINVQGILAYNNDDFKAENDIRTALGGQRRDDDTWIYGISADWTPKRYLSLSVGYRRENRDSSIESVEFDDKQVNAGLKVRFK